MKKRLFVAFATAALVLATGGAPAHAAEPNIGGGVLSGSATFGNAIPPLNTPCRPVAFTFDAFAALAIRNLGGSAWAGTIGNPEAGTGVSGSGSSTCENAAVGGGVFTLNRINVANPITSGTLLCHGLAGVTTGLQGSYTRTLTDLFAVVAGRCTINAGATDNVAMIVRAELIPSGETGDGVTAGITSARLSASLTVVPAGQLTD